VTWSSLPPDYLAPLAMVRCGGWVVNGLWVVRGRGRVVGGGCRLVWSRGWMVGLGFWVYWGTFV